jgi:phosphotransferase system enzyme I (PtsP)
MRVHERGDQRLDGILRLIEEAGRARPLPEVLGTLCAEIAQIACTDVVSVYVRETDPDDPEGRAVLVLVANVGFPQGAVGNVRLHVGEGITGFVAECLRPVSCAIARKDAHYKHVPGLGEEHYPAYLGLPLVQGARADGVLVLQRREAREFSPAEVALAAALAAPVAYALERARARRTEREITTAVASRTARLTATPMAPGVGLGRADPWPGPGGTRVTARPGDAVAHAFVALGRELDRARRRIEPNLDPDALRRLRALAVVLDDSRLRELAISECAKSGVAGGLRRLAREYARAPYRLGGIEDDTDAWLTDRAAEIEDFCLLLGAHVHGERIPSAGSVLVAERLTAFLALAAISRRATAVALGSHTEASGVGIAIARTAGLPVVAEVAGLFEWARPGDRILVNGDTGIVRVNPPATAVSQFRARVR